LLIAKFFQRYSIIALKQRIKSYPLKHRAHAFCVRGRYHGFLKMRCMGHSRSWFLGGFGRKTMLVCVGQEIFQICGRGNVLQLNVLLATFHVQMSRKGLNQYGRAAGTLPLNRWMHVNLLQQVAESSNNDCRY